MESEQYETLVTGCGCSGTTFVSKLLCLNDYNIGHDKKLLEKGIVTNAVCGRDVWVYNYKTNGIKEYVAKVLDVSCFTKRIHVVRNPLEVVASVQRKWMRWGKIWKHIEENVPDLDHSIPYHPLNTMKYWHYWNKRIEEVTHTRLRFEDILAKPRILADTVGIQFTKIIDPNFKVASSGKSKSAKWEQLEGIDPELCEKMKELAREYGYDVP